MPVPECGAGERAGEIGVVLAAAGSGTRLGFDTPKAFVDLGGRTLLERALDGLHDGLAAFAGGEGAHTPIPVVLTVSPDMMDTARALTTAEPNLQRWPHLAITCTTGGAERADSVLAGQRALHDRAPGTRIVLVHDAARCLTPAPMIRRLADAAIAQIPPHPTHTPAHATPGGEGDAAGVGKEDSAGAEVRAVIPVLPVVDTIKIVDAAGRVTATPARAQLRAVQTPQACDLRYQLAVTERLLAGAESAALITDDASIVELSGGAVATVAGDARALKITTPEDYAQALTMLDDKTATLPQER